MSKSSIELRAFRLPEFQKRNAIGKDATYEEIRRGRLKARKRGRSTIILAEDEAEWRANLPLLAFASSLEKLVCRAVNLFSPTPLGRCAIHARHSGDVMVITWAAPSKEQRGIRVGVSPGAFLPKSILSWRRIIISGRKGDVGTLYKFFEPHDLPSDEMFARGERALAKAAEETAKASL